MQARLEKTVETVRSSYWFVPSVMTVCAIALAALMVWIDVQTGSDVLSRHLGWYQSIKPSGARDVLSTIAGSTLTVAGTAFSITIAAISFASGKFGPRLLTNFMEDRGNTVTLGTFVSTFVYCLFVLRTVREGEDSDFVPQLAVAVGMLLALCSVAMLIYFIHHVPRMIHINNVVARIGRQLIAGIDHRFPALIGTPASERPESQELLLDGPSKSICADRPGYIQVLEQDDLLRHAERHNLRLRLHYRPGDFVSSGRPLIDAMPADAVSDEVCNQLRSAFAIGDERTPAGDLNFLITELVEIAGRSLSSGVNDPMTAITCLDWLGAAMSELATRKMPDPRRTGQDGTVRVIALPHSFATFVEQGFGQMRQYASRDAIAATHLLKTIGLVASSCRTQEQLDALDVERQRVVALARGSLEDAERPAIEELNEELQSLFAAGPGRIDERGAPSVGGTA